LDVDPGLLAEFLTNFLVEEVRVQRGISRAVLGLSGGVDSALAAYLAARAFGPENVLAVRMPYKISSQASLDHAQLVIDDLGIESMTVPITGMVDGYAEIEGIEATPHRIGNICARSRMIVLYDLAAKLGSLPIGTGNKTERMFGYYTWHGDDAPPVNPLGDLFKTQVFELSRWIGVPAAICDKAPTADLIAGQTDEGDFGITYAVADEILVLLLRGFVRDQVVAFGYADRDVDLVIGKVGGTHWKRELPTVAMVSVSSIGEYWLRPVDFRGGV
jgi:NAD+ synthase